MRIVTVLAIVLVIVAAAARPSNAGHKVVAGGASGPITGFWEASLTIPSGEVEFGLDLTEKGGVVTGALYNANERQDLSAGSYDGTTVELRMDYYDGRVIAKFSDAARTHLVGEYTRQTRSGIGKYPFKASRTTTNTQQVRGKRVELGANDISGNWILSVYNKDGKVDEVNDANLTVDGLRHGKAGVYGSLNPVSGDTGLLHGEIDAKPGAPATFRLQRFDGIHVTLITGSIQADGTLSGEYASGLSSRAPFKAVRKDKATAADPRPEDPFAVTTVSDPSAAFAFSIPDTEGRMVSLADERFKGKAVIIDIMGTWCPNCHDETPLLVDLYKKYNKDGLEIVALSYEYTPDTARSIRQINTFKAKYALPFPVLVAGTLAEGEIKRTLPQLVNFGAYPTTIFLGRDGRVRKIHAGFSGPATGEKFTAVKKEFDDLVRELLAE